MEATKMNDAPKRLLNKRNGPNTLLGIAGWVSLIFGVILFSLGVWTNLHREGGPLTASYRDDTVYVEAMYGKEARIPEDAELRAWQMTPEADPDAYSQNMKTAMTAMGRDGEAVPANTIYNIGFYVGDQEVEPAAPVNVTLHVLKDGFEAGEPIKVVHLAEDGAEVVADTAVDDAGFVSFTTDGFSPFAFAFDFVVIGNPGNGGPTIGDEIMPINGGETEDLSDMGRLLRGVTIKDNKGTEIEEGGTLYVGESYTIQMVFREGDVQAGDKEQFHWKEDGTMTFQIPSSFQVDTYKDVPLKITVDGKEVYIGDYSIDENGLLTLKLTDEGKKALETSNDIALTFDMTATAQATEGGDDQQVHFGDVGSGFNFTVTDQPRIDVQKSGGLSEDADGKGGTLSYTVTTTVKHGTVENVQVTDVLTPPQTDAIEVGKYQNVKVTLKRAADGPDGEAIELKPEDYELVPGEPDPDNPEKQTFIVKLKDPYATLYEGDVLNVSYEYDVDYNMKSVGLLSGNALNEVTVHGTMPLKDPDDPEGKPPVEVEEKRNSNVYINVATTGDGVIFKDQHYDEATHKLHYTLYTVIPKGKWEPLHIYDDMYVNYGGERWYLDEFKKDGGRVVVDSLTVKAVDLPNNRFDWKDSENPDKLQGDLQEFVGKSDKLQGFDFYAFGDNNKPEGYEATNVDGTTNVDQYVYYFRGRGLNIIFGFDHTRPYNDYWGKWGSWNYDKDRLVITEYDLDLSGETELTVSDINSTKTRILTPEQVLHAGITNNVYLRFSGYNPGYSVFFNNIEDINKTGVPDKNTNTIDYTVTVGLSDDTVRDYFKDFAEDIYDSHEKTGSWNYEYTMQVEFYDKLPDGWDYVPGSLYAVTKDRYGVSKTFAYKTESGSELSEDGRSISAPLDYFRGDIEFFNMFRNPDNLTEVSFHYTLKASRAWLMAHAEDESAVPINNHAEIKDKNMTHWKVDKTIPYLPNRLTKTAEQVGNTNLIEFTLEMNPAGADLDKYKNYLIVTDESTGIEIKPESIVVSKVTDDGTVVPLEDLGEITLDKELGTDQWGRLPEEQKSEKQEPEEQKPGEQKHQFKLKVPDGVSLRITYQALVTKSGDSVPVTNKASIDGVERSNSDYEKSLKVNDIDAGGSGSVNELTFEKTDSTGSKKLSNAKFQFYIVRQGTGLEEIKSIPIGEKTYSCYTKDDWVITTGEDGTFHIGGKDRNWNLAPGNYYILEEIKAPSGYEMLEEPVLFYFGFENKIAKESYPDAKAVLPGGTLTVGDPPIEYNLPETGGPGTFFYLTAGLALALSSGILLTVRRRLRRAR